MKRGHSASGVQTSSETIGLKVRLSMNQAIERGNVFLNSDRFLLNMEDEHGVFTTSHRIGENGQRVPNLTGKGAAFLGLRCRRGRIRKTFLISSRIR